MSPIILILDTLTIYVSIKFNLDFHLLMEINLHIQHSIDFIKNINNKKKR